MTMTKKEAKRLSRIAHDAYDVLHHLRLAGLRKLGFEAWRDHFARGKEDLAAKKAWDRLKRGFEAVGVPFHLDHDGKYAPIVLEAGAVEHVEELIRKTSEVLETKPRRYPDSVTIAGKTYRLKVYGRTIRPLNEREFAELQASVEADGIKVPIFVDPAGNVVDGKHRLVLADELGIDEVPVIVLEGYTRDQLHDLAEKLNACRRHLTKKEQADRRRAREERAKVKRAEGKSLRQIAEEEGVDPETIRQDLSDTDPAPQPVVGKDGRQRRTRKTTVQEREQRRRRAAELHAAEKTIPEIAEELGVGTGTVKRDLRAIKAQADLKDTAPRCIEEEVAPGCFLRVEEIPADSEEARDFRPWTAEEEVAPGCFLRVEEIPAGTEEASETASAEEAMQPEEEAASAWLEVDPESDALETCLQAAMHGLGEVMEAVRGTETEDKVDAVREIIRVVCWRIEDRGAL